MCGCGTTIGRCYDTNYDCKIVMHTWNVTGPNGLRIIVQSGKWSACNAARSLDKRHALVDLNDLAVEIGGGPGWVALQYTSDGAQYLAVRTSPTAKKGT